MSLTTPTGHPRSGVRAAGLASLELAPPAADPSHMGQISAASVYLPDRSQTPSPVPGQSRFAFTTHSSHGGETPVMHLLELTDNSTIIDNLPCHSGDPDLFFAETTGRAGAGEGAVRRLPDPPAVPGRRARPRRAMGRLGRRDLRPRRRDRPQAAHGVGRGRSRHDDNRPVRRAPPASTPLGHHRIALQHNNITENTCTTTLLHAD